MRVLGADEEHVVGVRLQIADDEGGLGSRVGRHHPPQTQLVGEIFYDERHHGGGAWKGGGGG